MQKLKIPIRTLYIHICISQHSGTWFSSLWCLSISETLRTQDDITLLSSVRWWNSPRENVNCRYILKWHFLVHFYVFFLFSFFFLFSQLYIDTKVSAFCAILGIIPRNSQILWWFTKVNYFLFSQNFHEDEFAIKLKKFY